jgi:hypothetical protein
MGSTRYFIELPETSEVCLLGEQCRLWDRLTDPWLRDPLRRSEEWIAGRDFVGGAGC